MTATLDDRYFEWLYSLVAATRNRDPRRSYWKLLRQLYTKEFVWLIPNDDNRLEDGKELRYEFLEHAGIDEIDPNWMDLGCSMLEMMIALSRRASFEYDGMTPVEWFGTFLRNLEIDRCNDAIFTNEIARDIDAILDRVIYRHYRRNGHGGIFPLNHTPHDQRKVELWYQLAEYVLEVYPP